MKLLYFLLVLSIVALVLPIYQYNIKYAVKESFENIDDLENPNAQYEMTIDLIDEFKRLRFLLDKYDNEAIKYPADSSLAKRRTALEHMLTKIVVHIQKYGHKISVDNIKTLLH